MKNKKIHFMGAGGAGCSAAFASAHHLGFQVTGCDKEKNSTYLDNKLRKLVFVGHSSHHLKNIDLLVYSPAVTSFDAGNEEIQFARENGLEVVTWDKFLAEELAKDKFVIAIAGTHGKGTVTAMVSVILEKAGLDPTCLVGAVVNDWGRNWRVGDSKYFVVEADEYSEKLLNFQPNIAAITNIEFDHPEYFKDLEQLKKTFKKFVGRLKKDSILITGPGVDFENPNGKTVKITAASDLNLKMLGEFNKVNAAIAASLSSELGIAESIINETLETFKGVARRFEFVGEEKGVLVFDDYAHHPTAITKTLQAAREKFPDKKIWLVFQPHLYTRTKALLPQFVSTFEGAPADEIILVAIFEAREKNTGEVSSEAITRAVKKRKIKYIPDLHDAAVHLVKNVSVGDMVISMGAGNIYELSQMLLRKLANKE